SGHSLRQRTRSAHQSGRRALSGAARGARAEARSADRASTGGAALRRACLRHPRGAARQRARPQPCAGWQVTGPGAPRRSTMTWLATLLLCVVSTVVVQAPALGQESVAPKGSLSQSETPPAQEAPAAAPEPAPALAQEPWFLMKSLKGTWVGNGLDSIGT